MSAAEALMPGPQGNTPRRYEVDKGHKTESYLTAIHGNPVQPSPGGAKYDPIAEDVVLEPSSSSPPKSDQIGLSERELLAYRDAPLWKAIRWALFILFWLLWILMFIVAIFLVIRSPGCEPPNRATWWQSAIAYNVWVPSFQDSDGDGEGDMNGVISRLNNLRKSGVQTIWPTPFLLSDSFSNAIRDHRAIDSHLGVNTVADEFLKRAASSDIHVVISFPLATTSIQHDWFLRSSTASLVENRNYSNFYYWLAKKPTTALASMFTKHKNVMYVHEPGNSKAALLNWRNNDVRVHMFNAVTSWIQRGVDGFHLPNIDYLARSADFSKPDWPAIYDVLRDLRKHVDIFMSESGSDRKIALFTNAEGASEESKKALAATGLDTIINYELTNVEKDSRICHLSEETVAICAHEILSDVLLFHYKNKDNWPHWELSNSRVSRLAARAGSRAHSELLLLLQLTLPGTNCFYYGEEIGMRDVANASQVPVQRGAMQWDDSANAGFSTNHSPKIPVNNDYVNVNWQKQWGEEKSSLKMFSKLAKLRQRDETLMQGETIINQIVNHSAFTLLRLPPLNSTANHIYVTAVNFGKAPEILPLDSFPGKAGLAEATIVTSTSNGVWRARDALPLTDSIEVPANTGLVFKYKQPLLL